MASGVTSQKLFSRNAVITYDHDPDTTAAIITTPDAGTTKRYLALENYENFAGLAMLTVSGSSSGMTLVDIVAAESATGTNVTTVVSSGAVLADAVGDFVKVECTAAQVKEVGDAGGFTFTHVGVRITCSNTGDEAAVTYWRANPKFATKDLTANAIS